MHWMKVRLHAENSGFEFQVNEVDLPQVGGQIYSQEQCYRIECEPQLDQHYLIWSVEPLQLLRHSASGDINSSIKVKYNQMLNITVTLQPALG